ncbi:hypothetical protein CGRA01v4_14653 [Colletotrichum graminicola]|nr:hypothetical protein CGRA01v4_14653 [Colletotrichum graminicola]
MNPKLAQSIFGWSLLGHFWWAGRHDKCMFTLTHGTGSNSLLLSSFSI